MTLTRLGKPIVRRVGDDLVVRVEPIGVRLRPFRGRRSRSTRFTWEDLRVLLGSPARTGREAFERAAPLAWQPVRGEWVWARRRGGADAEPELRDEG